VSRALALALAATFVALALAIALFAPRAGPQPTASHGTPLEPPKAAPDFVLRDSDGRPAHIVDRRASVTMLFFGYTHCPDACPLTLAALGRAYRSLDAVRRMHARIVFVTVDPVRDRPAVVRAYVRNFDPHIVGLTASSTELARVWAAYGIRVEAKTREVSHGDTIYAIDASRRIAYIYPADTPAADLGADMRALAR